MKYLLDTDTFSYLLKPGVPQHAQVKAHIGRKMPGEVVISCISLAEISSGIEQLRPRYPKKAETLFQALLEILKVISVLDFPSRASWLYGENRARLKCTGKDIGAMDVLIAAHALENGWVLVTNNTRHFDRIPDLALQNWTY